MKTVLVEKFIYTYDELPTELKTEAETLLQQRYDDVLTIIFEQDLKESFKSILPEYIDLNDIYYSQYEGATFTCKIDVEKYLKTKLNSINAKILTNNVDIEMHVDRRKYVYDKNSVYVELYKYDFDERKYPLINSFLNKCVEDLNNIKNNLCNELKKDGDNMINYLNNEENLIEYAKDFEFHYVEDNLTLESINNSI